jgi:hypothetical protein
LRPILGEFFTKGGDMERRTISIIACLGVPALTIGTDFTGALMRIIEALRRRRVEHRLAVDPGR